MLKPTRNPLFDSVRYFVNTTGEAGAIVFAQTGAPGPGQSLDSTNAVAQFVNATSSGRVAVGLALESVVNIDLSKQVLTREAEQVQVNSKCQIGIKGEWSTNRIVASAFGTGIQYPTTLYAGASGLLTTVFNTGLPVVGKAISAVDADGYAVVRIDL